jgi:hypothetical protein
MKVIHMNYKGVSKEITGISTNVKDTQNGIHGHQGKQYFQLPTSKLNCRPIAHRNGQRRDLLQKLWADGGLPSVR